MSESSSFVRLDRKILQWEWYTEPKVKSLFIHLLLLANYEPRKRHGELIDRGQVLTTLQQLSDGSGLSVGAVRGALGKLESTGEITVLSRPTNTIITITNYNLYQFGKKENGSSSDEPKSNESFEGWENQ